MLKKGVNYELLICANSCKLQPVARGQFLNLPPLQERTVSAMLFLKSQGHWKIVKAMG